MSRKFSEDMLTAYALGELTEDDRRIVERALEEDPSLQEKLRRIRQTVGYLAEKIAASPSARLDPARRAELRTALHKAVNDRKRWAFVFRPYVLGPVAAAALVLIVVMESGVPPAKEIPQMAEPEQLTKSQSPPPSNPTPDTSFGADAPAKTPSGDKLRQTMPRNSAPTARSAGSGAAEREASRQKAERKMEAEPSYRLRDVLPGRTEAKRGEAMERLAEKKSAGQPRSAIESEPAAPPPPEPAPASPSESASETMAPEGAALQSAGGATVIDRRNLDVNVPLVQLTVPFELLSEEKQKEILPKLQAEAGKRAAPPEHIILSAVRSESGCRITMADAKTGKELVSTEKPCDNLMNALFEMARKGAEAAE